MTIRSVEARLLAHEALLKALMLTHPKPQEAFYKFSQIYPEMVRDLNKASPDDVQLAKDLHAECDGLSRYFPK